MLGGWFVKGGPTYSVMFRWFVKNGLRSRNGHVVKLFVNNGLRPVVMWSCMLEGCL